MVFDKFSAPCPAALRNDLPATPWRNISMQSETLLTAWNYGQLWSIDVQRIYIYIYTHINLHIYNYIYSAHINMAMYIYIHINIFVCVCTAFFYFALPLVRGSRIGCWGWIRPRWLEKPALPEWDRSGCPAWPGKWRALKSNSIAAARCL